MQLLISQGDDRLALGLGDEVENGVGAKFNFTPNRWLAVWYLTSTGGNNTVKRKAIYLRFVNVF